MEYFKRIMFLLFPALLIIGYQNCSEVDFSSSSPQVNGYGNEGGTNSENKEPNGELRENNQDTGNEPVEFSCNSFQELNSGEVPARDSNKICYYIKLMNAQQSHDSGSWEEERNSRVLADDHDSGHEPRHPYILEQQEINLSFGSSWQLSLSGRYDDPNAPMLIDNFFLIEAYTPEQSILLARGTADAEPFINYETRQRGPILVGETTVTNFISYAPGGTAEVNAINIFTETPTNTPVDFRFNALDCGGAAVASNVYLVFH